MLAAVYHGPADLRVERFTPLIHPGEVLLKVNMPVSADRSASISTACTRGDVHQAK